MSQLSNSTAVYRKRHAKGFAFSSPPSTFSKYARKVFFKINHTVSAKVHRSCLEHTIASVSEQSLSVKWKNGTLPNLYFTPAILWVQGDLSCFPIMLKIVGDLGDLGSHTSILSVLGWVIYPPVHFSSSSIKQPCLSSQGYCEERHTE